MTSAPPALLGPMRDSADLLNNGDALRQRLAADGYLYLPGTLDREAVLNARRAVFERLADVDEIEQPAIEGIATGRSRRAEMISDLGTFWRSLAEHPALRAASHGDPLEKLMARIFAEPARAFDFLWLRTTTVGNASPLHFDHVYMNRGSQRVLSVWLPLGDVPQSDGPLFIVENSHRFDDLIESYRGHDVDRQPERPGAIDQDAHTLARQRGARLLSADFRAGDVVVFGMFTLHGSFTNESPTSRVRLSCDARFQPAADAQDERWFGANPPGHQGRGYGAMSSAQPLTATPIRR